MNNLIGNITTSTGKEMMGTLVLWHYNILKHQKQFFFNCPGEKKQPQKDPYVITVKTAFIS